MAALYLTLLSLLLSQSVFSTTVTVRNETELSAAISSKVDVIVIANNIVLKKLLPRISRTLSIINGTGCANQTTVRGSPGFCSIDGRNRVRHFSVSSGGNLTLSGNLELIRGRAQYGGSIHVTDGSTLSVKGVIFSFNSASGTTLAGGAIKIENNSAIFLNKVTFRRNTAGFGGALDVSGQSTANISLSYFLRNNGFIAGGAISFVGGSSGYINQGNIANNTSPTAPGVLVHSSSVTICKVFTTKNKGTIFSYDFVANKNASLSYSPFLRRNPNTAISIKDGQLSSINFACPLTA